MWLAPNMPESLSDRYAELLSASYDCADRIVLNAYFRMGHGAGGFRVWWRTLTGSDDTLDNTHLMRMAGRFSRRLHGYAKAEGIPLVHCQAGERKHELAEEYLAKTQITQGLFLILVGRAQAPVWDVGANHHLERKKPYVNHYSFHILDPQWGHITIKISGHPPFPAQVILNGHEYVACQARKAGISFTKEGNCFTHISDAAGLAKIADTLSEQPTIGRLSQACERWIYTTCLCFALDLEEQQRSGFHYQYSKYHKRKKKSAEWEVAVERPTYDLTIFKLHCGKLTLKIYTKGERVLRIEVVAHNTRELNCGRSLDKFPEVVSRLKSVLERFADALSCIDQCFIADEMLEQLPAASRVGKTIVGGIDLNKARMRRVIEALLALSSSPNGFTASEVAARVPALTKKTRPQSAPPPAFYNLKNPRAKHPPRGTAPPRRYEPLLTGLRAMTALLVLRDKAIKPLLAAAQPLRPKRGAHNPKPIDLHYDAIQAAMKGVFHELGLAA